jgi:hypothetical protein
VQRFVRSRALFSPRHRDCPPPEREVPRASGDDEPCPPSRQTGRRDEARRMLGEIYDWFTEGFDTADLKDAKSLLDALSG